MNRSANLAVALALGAFGGSIVSGQRLGPISTNHPAIEYSTRSTADPVARLNRRIQSGELTLTFEPVSGYLRSVLDALRVPTASQMLVYSKTSLQAKRISRTNPRALFFNDDVAVGWVRGADTLEVSSIDPQQGPIFYQLDQAPGERPQFTRSSRCLECHFSANTAGVPGLFLMSMLPLSDDPNEYAVGWSVDHRTPIADRWGGWYVTGTSVPDVHLGNVPVYHVKKGGVRAARAPKLQSVEGAFDAAAYPLLSSDVAALMVFSHQVQMTNLLTRINWLARILEHDRRVGVPVNRPGAAAEPDPLAALAAEVVDYLLFVHEAPLPDGIQGSSEFAERFTAAGPRDGHGRSLRDLDLRRRLLKYPCSYMIYSAAFDALPAAAKSAIYHRMWSVLSGQEAEAVYAELSLADRRAIVEILKATKNDLPKYFHQVTR